MLNKMKKFLPVSIGALLALSALAALYKPVELSWKPKEGATYNFKGHTVFHKVSTPAGVLDLTFDEKMTSTNKEVKPNGNVVLEAKHTDFKAMLGDIDASSMGMSLPKEINETTEIKRNGEIVSTTSDAPKEMQSPRMDEISTFIYPSKAVNVGDTWTHQVKGDSSKPTYNTVTTFKYLGEDTMNGTPAYKVGMDYKETNAPTNITATGTFWVAREDGELLKAEINVKNAELGGGLPPAEGDVTFERLSS